MNSVKPFDFYILGIDIDRYCEILIDQCGKDSPVIQTLDKEYDKIEQSYSKWADVLLGLRILLSEKGYTAEIEKCDKAFVKNYQDRGKEVQQKSMAERWDTESEEIAKEILKAKK